MVDDWWQSAPGKIAATDFEMGIWGEKSAAIFPVYTVCAKGLIQVTATSFILVFLCGGPLSLLGLGPGHTRSDLQYTAETLGA